MGFTARAPATNRCTFDQPTARAVAPPHKLSAELAATIRDRWFAGGDFAGLADALIDGVAEHIRRFGVTGMDARLAHAFADANSDHAERDGDDGADPLQQIIDYATACAAGMSPIDPGETIIARVDRNGHLVDEPRRLHRRQLGGVW